MTGKSIAIFLITLLIAVAIGWHLSSSNPEAKPASAEASAQSPSAKGSTQAPPPSLAKPATPGGWVPPTGEPVERYREAKTSEQKMKVINDFIVLGHDRNSNMLREAVNDADPKVRMLAIESAASMLTPEAAREVYRVSGASTDPDIRSMTWSFVAPHPMENRVAVYGEVLQKGPDAAFEETLSEMGRTPEMPLFDTLLFQSLAKDMPPARSARLLKEINDWLKPGGGNVPEFHSPSEAQAWWQANRQRYDQFMLRVDL